MAEYITKEEAISAFDWGDADVIEDYDDGCDFGFSRENIKSMINSIPAADVAPVVHGCWINGKCSNCGVEIPTDDAHDAIFENECHYCYSCGSKMDE